MNIKNFLNRSKQSKQSKAKSKGCISHNSEFKSNSNIQYLEAPYKLTKSCPVCMYYYCKHEQKEYIILTPTSQDTSKCYKYDILQNKWIHFTTYPITVVAECHSAGIDEEKDLLYISHGYGSIFAIFDLKNNFWTVQSLPKYNVGVVANAPCLILPNSSFHVLGLPFKSNIHLRYDTLQKQFARVSRTGINNNCYLETDSLIFLNAHNMLMVLGGYLNNAVTNKIWYAKYTDCHQKNFVWKEFPIELPFASTPQCCVIFGTVIIIWYRIDDNCPARMAILDCHNKLDKYEWIEPILVAYEEFIPNDVTSIVATRSNYLHFLNVYKQVHFKIHLEKFVPQNLYEKYVQDNINDNKDDVKCERCDELQILVDELMFKNSKLNEELVGVKKELNKLKRLNKNIDVRNYLNWTGDEIVDWILSLDEGKYEGYEDKLRVKFMEESVDGNAIVYINTLELKGWGVSHFMDRTNLYQHFQQLVKQNQHNEGNTAYI